MATNDDDRISRGDSGCLMMIGVIICSIAAGCKYGASTGWVVFGGSLIAISLFFFMLNYLDGRK